MEEKKKYCKTCEYHEHEDISDGFICVCIESDHCADWTLDEQVCEFWEEK